jgi:excisionase family DNA binding protein
MRAGVETYLSIERAAKYLGISEKTVRKWVLNREIPYHKIMKVIRFRVSEVEEWINTGGKFCPIADEAQEGELFEKTEAGEETENGGDGQITETEGGI